jgi:stage II sporulation protein M
MEKCRMHIKNTYRILYADIRKKKFFLAFTVSVFLLAAALSILKCPELRKIVSEVVNAIRRMAQDDRNRALLSIIFKIFMHNAFATFVALFSGALFFFIPLFMIMANGYVIGSVIIPHLTFIGLLIPHGLFEFPAFVLACSYGIWLGLWPFNRDRINTVKHRLRQSITVYFYVVVPLLVTAATIEGSLIYYTLGWLK